MIDDKKEFISLFTGTKIKNIGNGRVSVWEQKFKRIGMIRNKVAHFEPIFPFFMNVSIDGRPDVVNLLTKLKENYDHNSFGYQTEFADLKRLGFLHDYSVTTDIKWINQIVDLLK